MLTPIGNQLKSRGRRAATAMISAGVVLTDIVLVAGGHAGYGGLRTALPLFAVFSLLLLADGDLASVGLVFRPIRGFRYWIKATLASGALVGSVVLIVFLYFVVLGRELPVIGLPIDFVPSSFVRMCVVAPIVEEATYRFALCTAACAVFGPRRAILLSGSAFALLHVLYGNPGPDNMTAGFVLAWSYVASGSIFVPILLHALGNFCVLIAWVGIWYWRIGWGF